jgi:hypothetical protein
MDLRKTKLFRDRLSSFCSTQTQTYATLIINHSLIMPLVLPVSLSCLWNNFGILVLLLNDSAKVHSIFTIILIPEKYVLSPLLQVTAHGTYAM